VETCFLAGVQNLVGGSMPNSTASVTQYVMPNAQDISNLSKLGTRTRLLLCALPALSRNAQMGIIL
jgi:hypothetical protein